MRFVLIHGAFHGAWSWSRVIPELEARGHEAVAIDLPGHGERRAEKATLDSYLAAIDDVTRDGDVLVGHAEVGGWTVSATADAQPGRFARLIYVAASSPVDGKAIIQTAPITVDDPGLTAFVSRIETADNGPCLHMDRRGADDYLNNDCTAPDKDWAWEHLTDQPFEPVNTVFSMSSRWPEHIGRSYIACTDDRTYTRSYYNDQLLRLGLTTCAAIQASHSPFISRPAETARLIEMGAQGLF